MAKTNQFQVTYVTGNKMKLEETKSILKNLQFSIVSQNIDLPELQGEPDFIVKEKCKAAIKEIGGPVLVEDTCLCFNAFNGLPGPYIKWFLEKLKTSGLYKLLEKWEDKSAYAMSIFGISSGKEDNILIFKGICHGKIIEPEMDSQISWDSCFVPDGYDISFAEMDKNTKNKISHRYNALKALQEYFSDKDNTENFIKN